LIRRRLFPGTPPKFTLTTNNYALLKGPETKPLLSSHVGASEWLKSQKPGGVVKIERRLSVMNRTLASQTSLAIGKPSITRSQLIRKYHRYKRLYRKVEVSELAWCRPYVGMMAELMDQLEIRDSYPARSRRQSPDA